MRSSSQNPETAIKYHIAAAMIEPLFVSTNLLPNEQHSCFSSPTSVPCFHDENSIEATSSSHMYLSPKASLKFILNTPPRIKPHNHQYCNITADENNDNISNKNISNHGPCNMSYAITSQWDLDFPDR